MNRRGGAALALALMATAASLTAARAEPPAAERVSSPLAAASRVADWQLAHMDSFDYVTTFRRDTEGPRDWVQATFFIGLTELADATKDRRYVVALQDHGAKEGWGFDGRPRHADADAIGQVWLWTAARSGDRKQLAPIIARFDAVLAAPSTVSLDFGPKPPGGGDPYCQARWCWSDALFMAPAAWVGLSKATGDSRYLAHADSEFWATTQALYDPAEHLYFRDSRFIARRDAAGRKIFWGRGNGWVFGGLVRILSALPADHPSRPRYEALFKEMAAKLVTLQGTQGYWPVSLLEPQDTPETSGTGFFVYGLAWGINSGLLPAKTYRPAVDKGWAALERAVGPDGKLGWVQQIGVAPDKVVATDTQLYGAGAFLMAASQVSKLK
ncbi:glycoside hydrolase family 105 protein [Caulobacter segnis]|uniref:Glucuronyl hydrolase n=1 Tax=Caulobacter segnis TaxID=88688 RepID=A0A2W5V2B3_9CAUL|nr:glycoside hydrolase family 88 protein [Caulobacter segnis]PZR32847.1 MAG: glucuronyl hydrolase [Caulobacter segnis]